MGANAWDDTGNTENSQCSHTMSSLSQSHSNPSQLQPRFGKWWRLMLFHKRSYNFKRAFDKGLMTA